MGINMYQAFLVKYSEIGIKGKNRYIFENALKDRIVEKLRQCEGKFYVTKEQGRIFVEAEGDFDEDETLEALSQVFGIAHICPVVVVKDKEFEHLASEVVKYLKTEFGDAKMTFKVMAKRSDKQYSRTSPKICMDMGGVILDHLENLTVDVHQPDIYVNVEIRENAYIYVRSIKGPGGMPVGTSGRSMLLLSGGIDSPVAGYMIAKRGVQIEAVYFHAPPYTSERAKQKVVDLAKLISKYTGEIKLHIVNFTDIQLAIYEHCPHDELTIIMRRYMMKIAEHIANETGCLSLVTGESIGQVASQTMQSLVVTNEVCIMPVFRPLIAFDKQDIIDIAEKINTFETSILPYEDCCTIFVAKHPVTKPSLKKIMYSEKKLEGKNELKFIEELFEEAIREHEIISVG